MALSGQTTFTVTRNDLVDAVLRICGVTQDAGSPTATDYTNISQAMNMLIKSWQTENLMLWAYQTLAVPLVAADDQYTIGVGGQVNTGRPLRVIQAYIRQTVGTVNQDTPLKVAAREEYEGLTPKNQAGVPNTVYYDHQLSLGNLFVWPVPATADLPRTIYIVIQRPLQDMTASTDNFDFPQEWFLPLKWGICEEIMLEYELEPTKCQMITAKANYWREKINVWTREEAPTFFSPEYFYGYDGSGDL